MSESLSLAEKPAAAAAMDGLAAAFDLLVLLRGQGHAARLTQAPLNLGHRGASLGFAQHFVFLYHLRFQRLGELPSFGPQLRLLGR